MDFAQEQFTTIRHRNLWGQWTFVFEKSTLCSLRYYNEKELGQINPSTIQDCTYTDGELETILSPSVFRAYQITILQLNEYLSGKRQKFNILYKLYGTIFQKSVWETLKKIPYGETRSYKELAQMVGKPNAFRAVGRALHMNPIPFIIPCHRILGTKGNLVGFGLGLDMKRRLLIIESAIPQEMLFE